MHSIDDALSDLGVRFLLAMMGSASTKKIRPKDWWERARSALEISAASAESWQNMVSICAEKLQITTLRSKTIEEVAAVRDEIKALDGWERFSFLCERDALYIAAMAQHERKAQKGA